MPLVNAPVGAVEIPVSTVIEYLSTAVDFLTGNDVLMVFLAGSIISMALGMFGKAKRVVR